MSNSIGDNSYVVVYVCLTPDCGNYHGSSAMGRLELEKVMAPMHAKDAGQFRHMRSRCPSCGAERQRRWAKIMGVDESREIDQKLIAAYKST